MHAKEMTVYTRGQRSEQKKLPTSKSYNYGVVNPGIFSPSPTQKGGGLISSVKNFEWSKEKILEDIMYR